MSTNTNGNTKANTNANTRAQNKSNNKSKYILGGPKRKQLVLPGFNHSNKYIFKILKTKRNTNTNTNTNTNLNTNTDTNTYYSCESRPESGDLVLPGDCTPNG